ncbi:MAG: TolC family protein [Gammaproteobacteria bacterium]|nr:TolC family protein [Gammaproteobacteria bacterium]
MFIKAGHWPPHLSIHCWRVALAWAVLAAPAVMAQTPGVPIDPAGSLTLDDAVELALAHNPGLAALDAQADALDAMPSQAGALPDPVLSLNAMNLPTDTFNLDQEPMTQLQIGVSQSFPFPGKRKLKREAAEYEAQAGDARSAEQRNALQGAVRAAWWQVFAFDRSLEIVDQNKALMRDFVKIAETKYSVGQGLQQDVLLAQLELSRLLDREARLKGRRRSAQANLNALLDRPPNRAVMIARTPPNVRLPELPAEAVLLDQAGESRDLLNVHRELLEAADSRLSLAKRDVYPDFRLGAGYGFRQGNDALRGNRADFFSVMLSVNVPLYFGTKQSKAIDQRSHERAQRRYSLSAVLRSIEAEVTRHLADYDAAREQVLLLDTAIIPQAQQTVASMLAGYQVNKVDFLNVVNGQLTLYNAQINYWEALSQAKRSLAGVAAAVGTETIYE